MFILLALLYAARDSAPTTANVAHAHGLKTFTVSQAPVIQGFFNTNHPLPSGYIVATTGPPCGWSKVGRVPSDSTIILNNQGVGDYRPNNNYVHATPRRGVIQCSYGSVTVRSTINYGVQYEWHMNNWTRSVAITTNNLGYTVTITTSPWRTVSFCDNSKIRAYYEFPVIESGEEIPKQRGYPCDDLYTITLNLISTLSTMTLTPTTTITGGGGTPGDGGGGGTPGDGGGTPGGGTPGDGGGGGGDGCRPSCDDLPPFGGDDDDDDDGDDGDGGNGGDDDDDGICEFGEECYGAGEGDTDRDGVCEQNEPCAGDDNGDGICQYDERCADERNPCNNAGGCAQPSPDAALPPGSFPVPLLPTFWPRDMLTQALGGVSHTGTLDYNNLLEVLVNPEEFLTMNVRPVVDDFETLLPISLSLDIISRCPFVNFGDTGPGARIALAGGTTQILASITLSSKSVCDTWNAALSQNAQLAFRWFLATIGCIYVLLRLFGLVSSGAYRK